MISAFTIAAWLVFGIAKPDDASQEVTAIPFAQFSACERRMERLLPELLANASATGPQRRPITIKPFCTTIAPSFWIAPQEAF